MKIPTFDNMMNPLLKALHELGGSGTIEEIESKVIEMLNLPKDIAEIPHGDKSSKTEIEYRLGWTRTYLKKYGLLENSSRGVWALVEVGPQVKEIDPQEVVRTVKEMEPPKDKKVKNQNGTFSSPELDDLEEELQDWKGELLNLLFEITPSQFERLAQRLLRESGFTQVEVTGKSGDGGIDGKGIIKVGGLISFHAMFQCKRYTGSVSSSNIRDFRGALQGRADKGLFITTGTFTRDAVKEAQRDGAPPIDLIDGNELVMKLKELSLGLKTEFIEKVSINREWFQKI
ncbi:MAG TPA: restriction endonuclease [Chitinispirillaceae bacterium]|nr:restriction endonuclease [Chitinispirillaceae bacterium]